jgi:predicted RNase H-like nuclease (RuvC/YqgF family)
MKKIIVISLVLAMTTGILLAQNMGRMPGRNDAPMMRARPNPMQRGWEELNLSEAQMEKFGEARAAFERQNNILSAEIENLKLDVVEAMRKKNIRQAKELNQQISAKELQIKNARVDLMANHLKELNKDQKAIMLKNLHLMWGPRKRM